MKLSVLGDEGDSMREIPQKLKVSFSECAIREQHKQALRGWKRSGRSCCTTEGGVREPNASQSSGRTNSEEFGSD